MSSSSGDGAERRRRRRSIDFLLKRAHYLFLSLFLLGAAAAAAARAGVAFPEAPATPTRRPASSNSVVAPSSSNARSMRAKMRARQWNTENTAYFAPGQCANFASGSKSAQSAVNWAPGNRRRRPRGVKTIKTKQNKNNTRIIEPNQTIEK